MVSRGFKSYLVTRCSDPGVRQVMLVISLRSLTYSLQQVVGGGK